MLISLGCHNKVSFLTQAFILLGSTLFPLLGMYLTTDSSSESPQTLKFYYGGVNATVFTAQHCLL